MVTNLKGRHWRFPPHSAKPPPVAKVKVQPPPSSGRATCSKMDVAKYFAPPRLCAQAQGATGESRTSEGERYFSATEDGTGTNQPQATEAVKMG